MLVPRAGYPGSLPKSQLSSPVLDGTSLCQAVGDFEHTLCHRGMTYLVSRRYSSVANGNAADMLFLTGASVATHVVIVAVGSLAYIDFYDNPTFANTGTATGAVALNQQVGGTPAFQAWGGPTLIQPGAAMYNGLLPTTGLRVVGPERGECWTLAPGTYYYLAVTNQSGATAAFEIQCWLYEETIV